MALIPDVKEGDWHGLNKILKKLSTLRFGSESTPTFGGLVISGTLTLSGLTASRLISTDASKGLESTDLVSWVAGTTNQISVADDSDGTITLSTPQDIHTGASPIFAGLTVFSPTPILVFQDSNSLGAASVGFIEWRDSGGGRAGFLGNHTSSNDDFLWKNEQGGDIGIETTGSGKLVVTSDALILGLTTTETLQITEPTGTGYKFGGVPSTDFLYLQNQMAGAFQFHLYTADGDFGDFLQFNIYAQGKPDQQTNRSFLQIGYSSGLDSYLIRGRAIGGSSDLKNLIISADGTNTQLVLSKDPSDPVITMSGDLTMDGNLIVDGQNIGITGTNLIGLSTAGITVSGDISVADDIFMLGANPVISTTSFSAPLIISTQLGGGANSGDINIVTGLVSLGGDSGDVIFDTGTAAGTVGSVLLKSGGITAVTLDENQNIIITGGDTYWVGDGTGLPYACMYVDGTQAIIVALTSGVVAEVKDDGTTSLDDGWLAGDLNLITFPTGGDEHYLSVTKAGFYRIQWSLSFNTANPGANVEIHGGVAVDGTAIRNKAEAHRTIANNSDTGNMSGTAMVECPNGTEQISVWLLNTTNNADVTVEHGNISMVMVGGT